jgi:hypothetical protein
MLHIKLKIPILLLKTSETGMMAVSKHKSVYTPKPAACIHTDKFMGMDFNSIPVHDLPPQLNKERFYLFRNTPYSSSHLYIIYISLIFVCRLKVIKDLEVMCGNISTLENNRSNTITAEYCFSIGYTINVKGKRGFETPHNIPERMGYYVCTKDPLERSLPSWKKILWMKAKELLNLYDPVFAAGEYVVQFSRMSSPSHSCKMHKDKKDIGPQYIMYLGNYRNAILQAYDKEERSYRCFSKPYLMLKFDGRLKHRVLMENFVGVRYAIVFYKLYDFRQPFLAPILFPPEYLY